VTSGADLAIAIGTISTAVVAVVGLFVSLSINRADRRRADEQAIDDRQAAADVAAEDRQAAAQLAADDRRAAAERAADDREAAAIRAAADRAAMREDAERRHIVNLLLAVGHQIALYDGNPGTGTAMTAAGEVRLLLNALPPECAYAARKSFNVVRTMSAPRVVVEKQQWLGYGSKAVGELNADDMRNEIAFDIDRYQTSGLPPDKVWDDVDGLREWARRRWPRT
jgi:hypothetical protein